MERFIVGAEKQRHWQTVCWTKAKDMALWLCLLVTGASENFVSEAPRKFTYWLILIMFNKIEFVSRTNIYTGWPQKTSRIFACVMQRSSRNKSAENHVCNEQTSSNMCKKFCLKRFHISRYKKQNSATHHKANYASGLSFTLPLVRRLRQNVTVGRIISQLISRKCAEQVLHFSLPLLLDAFSTAMWLFRFWLSGVDIMPFVPDNILKIFEVRKRFALFTPEGIYCFQRVLAIAIPSVRPSVRSSVTRVDQSKTVQARINKSSPSAAWKILVSRTVKL